MNGEWTCGHCGKAFTGRPRADGRPRVACSPRCGGALSMARARANGVAAAAAAALASTHTATCAYGPCGRAFTYTATAARAAAKPRRYCSARCVSFGNRKAPPPTAPPAAAPTASPAGAPTPDARPQSTPASRQASARARHQEAADRRREIVAAGGDRLDIETGRRGGLQKPGRDPATGEVDYTAAEAEFLKAVDRFKREKHRPFPTLTELLAVLRGLGWRKVVGPETAADAPAEAPAVAPP